MLRRWPIALLLALAAGGLARAHTVGRGSTERVKKGRPIEQMHMYWAAAASATEAQIVSFSGPQMVVGDRFEIIDQQGLLGTARVTRVDQVDYGCGGATYEQASARFETAASRAAFGYVVAISLGASKPRLRSRVMPAEEIRNAPNVTYTGQYMDLGVDFDADRQADMVRIFYQCSPPGGGAQYGGQATCADIWMLVRGKWTVIEKATFPVCY